MKRIWFKISRPRLRSRPKLVYDQTQSSAHPCVPRPKLQGLDGSSSALQSGPWSGDGLIRTPPVWKVWTMVWRWSDQISIWSENPDHRRIRAQLGLIITSSSALGSDQERLRVHLGLSRSDFERTWV